MTYTINSTPQSSVNAPLAPPAKVLKKMMDEQRSGKVSIYDPEDSSIGWCVYFGGGQVHFAQSIGGQVQRLNYLITQHFPQLEALKASSFESDYQWICDHWQSHHIPLNMIRQVLTTLTTEALVHVLAMPQANIEFSSSIGLDPLLLSVPFRQLILPVRETINQWVTQQASIHSPFNRFKILDHDELGNLQTESSVLNEKLPTLIAEGYSLYELALKLGQTTESLSQFLVPCIGNGILALKPFNVPKIEHRPVIACVDDSKTIQQFVKLALEPSGYDVVSLLDPTEALQTLLDRQPQLILMDIEMPKLDGYELCKMVRQIEVLRKTPVVMLTGREGLIDRVRAKMIGCSAYLTKPFNPNEMLSLVQKLTREAAQSAL